MPLFKPDPFESDLAQMIFPELNCGELSEEDAARLVELGVGGFCVYEGSKADIQRWIASLQAQAREPLLFCGDYEWGIGRHVEDGTLFPPMMAVGAAGSETMAYRKGLVTGRESRALGVDWVLAPVVDLATRPDNPIVNTRAFSDDPRTTLQFARAFLRGLADAGCLGCLKHFPGHGETWTDSHLDLPRLDLSAEQLWERELLAYRELAGACGSIMLGHLLIPALDPEHPVSLSKPAVQGLLRARLGFQGLVATDALLMGAIARHYSLRQAAVLAVNAGVDVLLVPQDPLALHAALAQAYEAGEISPERVSEAAARVRSFKSAVPALPRAGLDSVGSAAHRAEAGALAEAALAWIKKPERPFLSPGETVACLELGARGSEEASAAFLEELRLASVEVRPYEEGWPGKRLAAVFSSPRAFSGAINLSAEEARRLAAILAAGPGAVVSFGSPFVFPEPDSMAAALCAFSELEAAQRGAARALLGRFEPRGRLPLNFSRARA